MDKYTPIIQQYLKIKAQHKDKLLLFRVGDFYEFFFEDAIEVSKLLALVLTSKSNSSDKSIPMAGFPVRSSMFYITKLMRLNKKLAICEQIGQVKKNGLIDRAVTKILTPGTFFNDSYLSEDRNNYIACVSVLEDVFGIAALDVSTGYFFITRADNRSDLYNELDKINPVEVIVSEKSKNLNFLNKKLFFSKVLCEKFDYDFCYNILLNFFGYNELSKINTDFYKSGIISAGCLLDFILCTQCVKLENVISLEIHGLDNFLYLDHSSRKNLEIFKGLNDNEKDSLFYVIDKTVTSMGKRLLRMWLTYPLTNHNILIDRLSSVELLKENQSYLKISSLLSNIFDLERILSKIVFSISKPNDLKKLKQSLEILPLIKKELESFKLTGLLEVIFSNINSFDKIINLIDRSIIDNHVFNLKDGNFIKSGFDRKLDNYRSISVNKNKALFDYQEIEKVRLGISNLTINTIGNSIFIEINKSDVCKVDLSYKKISSNLRVYRFTTDKLLAIDRDIINSKSVALDREKKIYKIILYIIKKNIYKIKATSKYLAMLDVLNSFAMHADFSNWCKPLLVSDSIIEIKDGRHPIIEFKKNNIFVPNDLFLDLNKKALIITGANMGGKSTYMRQTAIIILLAYIGSFVPASFAKIGVIDKIFTRIGSGDDLSNSNSTFMLEMREISEILHKSTKNSFVIIDEIGRGTDYFDGKALAFSIIKYLIEINKSFFLFSTHFHDLHKVCDNFKSIDKIYFLVFKNDDFITFSYKFEYGYSVNSFGIEVAFMADLPKVIIEQANYFKKVNELDYLNCLKFKDIINVITELNPDNLSPKEALNVIYFLKDLINKS